MTEILTSDISEDEVRLAEVWQDPAHPDVLLCSHELGEGPVTEDNLPGPLVQAPDVHLRDKELHGEVPVLGPTEEVSLGRIQSRQS